METNNVSTEKKGSILNSLAIAGFIGIVVLLAWMSIQLVQLFPSAFSSLASLAEGVNQAADNIGDKETEMGTLVLSSDTSLISNGEDVTINWSKGDSVGSYVFAYDCTDGVSVAQTDAVTKRSLNCDTNYNVGDTNSLSLAIESEKDRYADVSYSISFLKSNDTRPRAAGSDVVTVINDDINGFATTKPADTTDLTVVEPVEVATPEPVNPVVTAPAPTTPTPVTPSEPIYTYQYAYEIPTSDPNGFTDLATTYIGVGTVSAGRFTAKLLDQDQDGAIQFSVKNFGTKTSKTWTYSVAMPNGTIYESKTQTALKPNEETILTIGFRAGEDTSHTFKVKVVESTDKNTKNNSFSQSVSFAK